MGQSAQQPAPKHTVALVEQIVGGEPGAKLRAQVAERRSDATREQVKDAFQDACLLALRHARGCSEGEIYTWIRTTTMHKVSEAVERARREQLAGANAAELCEPRAGAVEGPEQKLIEREDRADLERLMAAVLERLSGRQRDVVALYARGRKRPEIAEQLRLTSRTVKRELERILALGRAEVMLFAGHGCEEGEELVGRFAFGLASSRELGEAQLHLASCPRCSAFYERLDAWHQKAAAMLPLPAAEQVDPGIVGRTIHAGGEAVAELKQQLVDGGAQLKQQAASAYYRAVDPTPLSAVRPGAAATAVAGCLAIGGGATYCAEQGFSPLGDVKAIIAPQAQKERPKRARKAAERPSPAAPVTIPAPAQEPTPPQPPPEHPPPRPVREPPPPPPAPEQEFEPTSPAGAGATAARSSAPPSEPAPAPARGPAEFGGP